MRVLVSILISATLLAACSTMNSSVVPGSAIRAAGARQNAHAIYKIYVANVGGGTITTYDPDGTQTNPTINTGYYLFSIAVAPTGKIYALTFDPLLGPNTDGTVSSYNPDGTQTTPTIKIKERGYHSPSGIAVDSSGKIYVLSSLHNGTRGTVTTYTPDGTPTTPTFRTGDDSSAIAIDSNGKIYVGNDTGKGGKNSVTTYLPDGSPTTPTITRGVHQPAAIAVASDGEIFVANTNSRPEGGAGYLTVYNADGSGPIHSIKDSEAPGGLAVTGNKVFLASSNANNSIFRTYTLEGHRIAPTITTGLYEPSGIAVH